jgi:hypothetical protein
MENDENLRYPTGRFAPQVNYSYEELLKLIDKIEALPGKLRKVADGLSAAQLDTPYREGGWTLRQVIHHMADSHMNAYIRLKWTLTEDRPVIKAYDEKRWAETPETPLNPGMSVILLTALHIKWVNLLRSLGPEDFEKGFVHPETGKFVTLARQVALYAWHGDHHVGHLQLVSAKAG